MDYAHNTVRNFRLIFALLVLAWLGAVAQIAHGAELPRQPQGRCVLDESNALTAKEYVELEGQCEDMDRSGDGQFEVIITDDFRGLTKEVFATQVFNQWGIGHKGINDGVLIVLNPKQRQWRIEVGRGLENILLPSTTLNVARQRGVPMWKQARWGEGLIGVTSEIAMLMHQAANARKAPPAPPAAAPTAGPTIKSADPEIPWFIVFGVGWFILLITLVAWRYLREDKKLEKQRSYTPPKRKYPKLEPDEPTGWRGETIISSPDGDHTKVPSSPKVTTPPAPTPVASTPVRRPSDYTPTPPPVVVVAPPTPAVIPVPVVVPSPLDDMSARLDRAEAARLERERAALALENERREAAARRRREEERAEEERRARRRRREEEEDRRRSSSSYDSGSGGSWDSGGGGFSGGGGGDSGGGGSGGDF